METERLLLRKFNHDDWSDLYEYLSQKAVVKYEPYDIFTEEESRQEAIRRTESDDFWAVCLKSSGKLIGNIYLSEKEFFTWELGYVFNSDYNGYGYATEAARALADYVFKDKNANRIEAMCNPLNKQSWKLLERLGMRREGNLLKNVFFKRDSNGLPIWLDTYIYGILAEEWFEK